jgi:hypothetical protein
LPFESDTCYVFLIFKLADQAGLLLPTSLKVIGNRRRNARRLHRPATLSY